MNVIVFASRKGGTGKSTLAAHLAAHVHKSTKPCLLIDGDPQGSLTLWHKLRGTNDLSSVSPTFDTHVHDALQYAALECGSDAARKRKTDADTAREKRRAESQKAGRYNPNSYAHKRARAR